MSEAFRLRVLKALTTVLERATYVDSDGVTQTFEGRVFRGRLRYGEKDPMPMISIIEPPIPEEPRMGGNTAPISSTPWMLLIQGFVSDDPDHPTDGAQALLAEIRRVLVEEKSRGQGNDMLDLGPARPVSTPNNVVEMQIGAGAVRPPDDISDTAYLWLYLTLKLSEDLRTPYI